MAEVPLRRRHLHLPSLLAVTLLLLAGPRASAQLEEPHSPRLEAPLTILQINDVYLTTPIPQLNVGGLARVATIKKRIAAEGRTPFLMVAGDFLSPSVSSSVFKGEQMIAAFNAAGVDLATLGNHEFDFGDDVLIAQMAKATFTWIVANVIDTRTGKPIGGAEPYVMRQFGRLKVGFLGLCLNTTDVRPDTLKHTRLDDPVATAGVYIPRMKAEGADIIVLLSHVRVEVDRAIAERFPDVDVIVGGHEHFVITAVENRTFISKAGSDARWVARIDVNKRPSGIVERVFELIPVNADVKDDPGTAAVVNAYESKLGAELDSEIGTAAVDLDAVSLHLRTAEGSLGDLVADAVRAGAQTDVAIVNSGSIRGERPYPAGPITRRTVQSIHPLGNTVGVVEVPGRVIKQALENGVSRLPQPAGRFPQVSGMTFDLDASKPVGQRVSGIRVADRPLDDDRTYTVALPDYVMKGGDEYSMFAGQRVLVSPDAGELLTAMLERYITRQKTVGAAVAGRIRLTR